VGFWLRPWNSASNAREKCKKFGDPSEGNCSVNLFEKYDIATPRYTSYPTVPYWSDPPSREQWLSELKKSFAKPPVPWALYLHIPFCETLCSFCGCNTSITRNHKFELPYINHILQELEIYQSHIDLTHHPLKQIHIGGGTPSFLSSENLDFLLDGIFSRLKMKRKILDGSMEIDPRHINEDQLKVLRRYG